VRELLELVLEEAVEVLRAVDAVEDVRSHVGRV
jgi:hypothetical protein